MSLFILAAAIPMGITIVWCYCHSSHTDSPKRYYYGGQRSHQHQQRRRQEHCQQGQRQGSLWRPTNRGYGGDSAEEQTRLNRVCGSSSSAEMIPSSSSVDSMNIHEESFEREDAEAEDREQRLNCYKNVLNSCLQIVIFLWL